MSKERDSIQSRFSCCITGGGDIEKRMKKWQICSANELAGVAGKVKKLDSITPTIRRTSSTGTRGLQYSKNGRE